MCIRDRTNASSDIRGATGVASCPPVARGVPPTANTPTAITQATSINHLNDEREMDMTTLQPHLSLRRQAARPIQLGIAGRPATRAEPPTERTNRYGNQTGTGRK